MKATRREPQDIEYTILKFPMTIHGPNGDVKGKKGDYLITEGDRQYFMSPGDFTAAFTPRIDPPSTPPAYIPYPVPYPQPYPVYPAPRWYYQPLWNTYPNVTIGGTQLLHTHLTTNASNAVLTSGSLASIAAGGWDGSTNVVLGSAVGD